MNIESDIVSVLKAARAESDMINVLEALSLDVNNFQHAFDVALAMENQNLVKMLYSSYNASKIVVELTLPGRAASKRAKNDNK